MPELRTSVFPAEHSRNFSRCRATSPVDTSLSREWVRPFVNILGHDEMRIGRRRDLRQMRDAKNLMLAAERSHLGADGIRDFAADVCVDLVEDEQRNRILRGERRFDREHQP